MSRPEAQTQIANVLVDRIEIRGHDLINELVGHYTYTEILFFLLRDRFPQPAETRVLDAILVTLMGMGSPPRRSSPGWPRTACLRKCRWP